MTLGLGVDHQNWMLIVRTGRLFLDSRGPLSVDYQKGMQRQFNLDLQNLMSPCLLVFIDDAVFEVQINNYLNNACITK